MNSGRLPWSALCLLVVAYGSAAFAGFFAPYHYEAQHRKLAFSPPTRVHFFDASGHFHLRPFVYRSAWSPGRPGHYEEDRTSAYPIRFFVLDGNDATHAPRRHLFGTLEPGCIFPLGSDSFGRDIFSRLLYGGRVSLFGSLGAALISVILGLVLGGAAGFFGRWADTLIMRIADVFLGMPWLYLLLAVRATLPLHTDSRQAYALLLIVLGVVGWARPARLVRGMVLAAKEAEFVLAARSFGASDFYLLREHILPSASGVVFAQLSIYIPQYLLAEITLSFFGLGVSEPIPSWGNMLGNLHGFTVDAYWWLFVPAVTVFAILLAYHRLFSYIKRRTSVIFS